VRMPSVGSFRLRSKALDCPHQRAQVAEAVGFSRLGRRVTSLAYRHVVRHNHAVELGIPKGFHDIVHVHVPIVRKRFEKIGHGRTDVPKVNLINLSAGSGQDSATSMGVSATGEFACGRDPGEQPATQHGGAPEQK